MAATLVHDPREQLELEIEEDIEPKVLRPVDRYHLKRRIRGDYYLCPATVALIAPHERVVYPSPVAMLLETFAEHPVLDGLDRSQRPAQVLACLLEMGPMTAPDLAEFLDAPVRWIREVLTALIVRGSVQIMPGSAPFLWEIPPHLDHR